MKTKTFNIYEQDNKVVQDAYSLLVANILFEKDKSKLKSIALCSCKPGMGKTTLSIGLAVTMANSGWKVLLVDADLRKPSAAKRLNAKSVFGLSEHLAGIVWLDEALCKTNFENLEYLPCGENHPNPMSLLSSSAFNEFTDKMREKYDFVIFDTPALMSVADGALIASKADAAVLIAEMGVTSISTIKKAQRQLEKANTRIIGVVLNKVKKKHYKRYLDSYNYFNNEKRFMKNKEYKKVPESIFLGK